MITIVNSPPMRKLFMQTPHADDMGLMEFLNPAQYHAIVAGGAALRWYQGMPVGNSDIDLFFQSAQDYHRMVEKMDMVVSLGAKNDNTILDFQLNIIDNLKSNTPMIKPQWSGSLIFSSDNARTYQIRDRDNENPVKVQLIKTYFYNSPDDIFKTFDITVCQVATDGYTWWVGQDFVEDLRHRRLRFDKIMPDAVKRMIKYWCYGFEPAPDLINSIVTTPDITWRYDNPSEDYNVF